MANFAMRTDQDVQIVQFEDSQIMDEVYAQRVGARLLKLVDEMDHDAMVLNLSKVKFMASAMIGQLVLLRNKCKNAKVKLAICDLNDSICEAIRLMRIDQILQVYETETEAVEQLSAPTRPSA